LLPVIFLSQYFVLGCSLFLAGTVPVPAAAQSADRPCVEQETATGMASSVDTGEAASGHKDHLERWSGTYREHPVKATNPVSIPARWLIRIFQRYISPVDGASCSFYPSCSSYGLQAIEKHGVLIGIPMATERIIRNHHPNNPARYPVSEIGRHFYYLDPVEANDFWHATAP